MKKGPFILISILLAVMLAGSPFASAKAEPAVNINVLNMPAGGVLTLSEGQSYTFEIQVTSDTPFILAMAMTNSYYPGKGVSWHPHSDRATQATSAVLSLTVIGKQSTGSLPAVCDWPTIGTCWDAGTAPQAIEVGVRFQGGEVNSNVFPFTVVVP